MITYLKGDLLHSPAQVLVNTVNVVGVMGKGIALEFKNCYPEMFRYYQQLCDEKILDVGKLSLWKSEDKWILLFPTKKHWRNPSKMEYIETGLQKFVQSYYRFGIESIAFPRLGCGNGKLQWSEVKPLMEKYLGELPIQIYIYVDNYSEDIAEHEQVDVMERWLHSYITEIGFGMLKEDIQKRIAVNPEVELENGHRAKVEWQNEQIIIQNGVQRVIEEKDMCQLWNFIRENGVFKCDSIPEKYSEYAGDVIALLKKLEYLQPVIVSDNGIDFGKKSNGFQYIGK
jgi:O-acetyl-ADP-ribose deacetylase (regulator of RNase III)